jgi:ribonucleoside-triphosphate reductase
MKIKKISKGDVRFTVDMEVDKTSSYQFKNGVVTHNTSSLVLGCSSGIHGWHNDYYIRRIRVGKNESIYTYLQIHHPSLVEDEYFRPHDQAVISIPQKAPENAIYRFEKPIELLERVKKFNIEWVREGHNDGENSNNVSVTVSIKKEYGKRDENGIKPLINNEWEEVGEWMWENREFFNGISVLPYDHGTYKQAPFENCTKEVYDEMLKSLKEIDLTKVIELEDNTDLKGEVACSGGQCEIDVDKTNLIKE